MIKDREEADDLEVTIYENPDPRKNMTARPGHICIGKASSDGELGCRVDDLLAPRR